VDKATWAARLARKIQWCPCILENYGQIGNAITNELKPLAPGEIALMLCEFLALALPDIAIDWY
jgi:hypothetical protein